MGVISYVGKIVTELQKSNVSFVLLELPELPYYTDYLDPVKTKAMVKNLEDFAAIYHIPYISYLNDKRFTLEDFTDMPDHLNATGANKISQIINADILTKFIKVS